MEVVLTMEDRKARIAALRAKAGRAKLPPPTTDPHHPPVLQIVAALVNNNNNMNATPPPQKKPKGGQEKKNQQESILDKALRQAQAEAKSAPTSVAAIEDLAPKKMNADLKREIQPKLTKLERRTQKAIVALLRERLEQEASAEIDD